MRHLLTSTNGHGFPSDFSAPVAQLLVERLHQGPPQPQRGAAARRVDGDPRRDPAAPPARRGVHVQHRVRHPRRARRPGRRPGAARAHGGADPRAARDDRDRASPSPPAPTSDARRTTATATTDWSRSTVPTGSGRRCRVPVRCRRPRVDGGRRGGVPADAARRWRRRPARRSRRGDDDRPADADDPGTDTVFLDGQSWGFGGGVDIERRHPWNVPGRYGWVGGTGTSAYVVPSDDSVAVLLTQVELAGPTGSPVIEGFWTAAAEHLGHHGPLTPLTRADGHGQARCRGVRRRVSAASDRVGSLATRRPRCRAEAGR